ncbi:hypothetical protein C8F01DRAFT_501652 [Mycena amicta]|nr:hypothetical protein C8F01DRAFT_501652 [Mycena amicta]
MHPQMSILTKTTKRPRFMNNPPYQHPWFHRNARPFQLPHRINDPRPKHRHPRRERFQPPQLRLESGGRQKRQVHTPLGPRSPIKATSRSTSPQKNVDMPQKQINAEFGVPHPSARTPPGFGRRSGAASNAVVPAKERTESPVVPMEVDSEPPYQSLYADLAIDASAIQQEKPTTTRTESPARAKPSRLVNLADFMTPQAPRTGAAAFRTAKNPVGGLPQTRHSLAGVLGPQRIRITEESPWKKSEPLVTPARPMAPPPTPVRPTVSEAERRAIQERRRSGLNAPDMFWADGAPGLSPRKSPTKKTLAGVKEAASSDNEDADPTAMLREMLDTVDVLKKRRESIMADVGRKSLGGLMMAAAPLVLLNEAPDDAAEMEVDAHTTAPVPAPTPARRGRQATATPPPEPKEDVTQKPTPSPSKPARRGRKAAAPAIVEPQAEAEVEIEPPKPRRGRKATAEPESVGEDSEEPAALLTIPSAPTKTRRGRSASKEPEVAAAPAKTRRGRTATVEPESDAEAPVPATRRPRKPPSTNNAQPVVPATEPAVPATRRGRTAATPASAPERKTRARSRAVNEDDDDPLDSIMADPEIEVVAVVAPKRRGASTKRQAPSSKAVKEEEAEPVLEPTRKAPAAPKPRSTRKGAATPASAPALLVEKENARAGGEDSEEVVEPVKVRVSRSRKAKETASEVVVESEAAAPTARRTRTRTRT